MTAFRAVGAEIGTAARTGLDGTTVDSASAKDAFHIRHCFIASRDLLFPRAADLCAIHELLDVRYCDETRPQLPQPKGVYY